MYSLSTDQDSLSFSHSMADAVLLPCLSCLQRIIGSENERRETRERVEREGTAALLCKGVCKSVSERERRSRRAKDKKREEKGDHFWETIKSNYHSLAQFTHSLTLTHFRSLLSSAHNLTIEDNNTKTQEDTHTHTQVSKGKRKRARVFSAAVLSQSLSLSHSHSNSGFGQLSVKLDRRSDDAAHNRKAVVTMTTMRACMCMCMCVHVCAEIALLCLCGESE